MSKTMTKSQEPERTYFSLLQAKSELSNRLSPPVETHEIAMWVFLGPDDRVRDHSRRTGGIAAYADDRDRATGKGSEPALRFFFEPAAGKFDYVTPLHGAYFLVDDIASFQPLDRFVTMEALKERWQEYCRSEVEAFIQARIEESLLHDFHPITGHTQASAQGDDAYPPRKDALFALSEIVAIEERYFAEWAMTDNSATGLRKSVSANAIIAAFNVKRDDGDNARWWKERTRNARRYGLESLRAEKGRARKPSRWYLVLVGVWLIDKGHMTRGAVLAAIRKSFPDLIDQANELIPPPTSASDR